MQALLLVLSASLFCEFHSWRLPHAALLGHSRTVYHVVFAPKGDYLVSGGWAEMLLFWLPTVKLVHEFSTRPFSVDSLAVSRLGLVAYGINTEIVLYDPLKKKEIRRLKGHSFHSFADLAFSQSGLMLVGGNRDSIYMWDVNSGR